MTKLITYGSTFALAACVFAAPAVAQLPSASTAALGMGDNFTAVARGYHAVAWNPALLAAPNGPRRSLAIGQLRLVTGLDPVTLGDIAEFEGEVVSDAARRRWLEQIRADGGESGTGGADVTWVAAQVGRFGVQVSTTGRAMAELSPGAAELFLFGNAGFNNGEPRVIDIGDSELNGSAATTAALSYAQPFTTTVGTISIGATVKYSLGHVMLMGENRGSSITADPVIDLEFPIVSTNGELNNGSGIGVDLGIALVRERLTIAAAVENVFNTFEWETDNLVYRPGTALLDGNTYDTDFDEHSFAQAPADLRARIDDMKYEPALRAGIAYAATSELTIAADIHSRFGESHFTNEPKFHAGAGVQYQVMPFLLLRAGGAAITDGFQFGGGLGLKVGPIGLDAAIARRSGSTISMFTLLSTGL